MSGRWLRALTLLATLGVAMAPAPIRAALHFTLESRPAQQSPPVEALTVPFTSGPYNPVSSANAYVGPILITISGLGHVTPLQMSDAFYLFTNPSGNPIPPVHDPSSSFTVLINGKTADATVNPIPAYAPSHSYTFRFVATGGRISFAINDLFTDDNSGNLTVSIYGIPLPPLAESLTVPFTAGPYNPVSSQHSYNSPVVVNISGSGHVTPLQMSDAFYLFSDPSGNPIPPVHNPDSLFTVLINGNTANAAVNPIPPYDPSHSYTFRFMATGGRISFAINDVGTFDNSGNLTVSIYGVPSTPTATPTPTSTPTPIPTPTLTNTPVPTRTPTPMPTPTPQTSFSVSAVQVEQNTGQPHAPIVTQSEPGQTVQLSTYVDFNSLPNRSSAFVRWLISRDGKQVGDLRFQERRNSQDTDSAWYHTTFTPANPGTFTVECDVSVNDQNDSDTTSFTVVAPAPAPTATPAPQPFWYSFDRLRTADAAGRTTTQFRVGAHVFAIGRYTLHNTDNAWAVFVTQSYQYGIVSGHSIRWVSGKHPLHQTWGAVDGLNKVRVPYTPPPPNPGSPYVQVRITVRIVIDGQRKERSTIISVRS